MLRIRTDAVRLSMERISDIFSSKVFPNNILVGLDQPIQLWIDGSSPANMLFGKTLELKMSLRAIAATRHALIVTNALKQAPGGVRGA